MPPCHNLFRRTWSIAAGVAVTALLVALSGCLSDSSDTTVSGPLSGTFNYTKTEGAFLLGGLGQYEVLVPQTREIWIGHDGSGRLRTSFEDPVFFGDRDRAEWQDNPAEWLQERTEDETALADFSFIDVSGLPTDPDALRDHVEGGLDTTDAGMGPAAWEVFIAAHGFLWETVPPPALSEAVLTMLSETPGIDVEQDDVDLAGRAATRFSVTSPNGQLLSVMWLDPMSGRLLGEQQELLTPTPTIDAEAPVIIKWATYLRSEVVDTTADR